MAFEGAQMVPVYDMNKSDGNGFMGGGAGWMWVVMLFFLLAWGGGFGGFGGANGAVNPLVLSKWVCVKDSIRLTPQ